ncbi:MAG: thioredoxin family protein [Verrucomicrobiota bacterium]
MKAAFTSLLLVASALFSNAANSDWTTNLDAAFKQAKQENKHVLVEFTGSDWCPPCIQMRKNVFSKSSFTSKAKEDFILVELDFPRGDKATARKNEPHAEKYNIEGFPTVILFDPTGKEYERFFASQFPTINQFLAHLKSAKTTS